MTPPQAMFRRGRIEEVLSRLENRRRMTRRHLDLPEYDSIKGQIQGSLSELDYVIDMLKYEFEIGDQEMNEGDES